MADFAKVRQNMERLGYAVSAFPTAAEAAAYLDREIDGKTVGIGGSITVEQLGLYEKLCPHNTVWWHWRVPDGTTGTEVLRNAACCDVYLSSVNGLAETGEIVNIDGNCNRVAAICYGHQKVYLIAGQNKLAEDYNAALRRARNIAAPRNAQRLNKHTPCAAKGDRCYDCASSERICRGLSVLWGPPSAAAYEVILIGEDLGY